MASRASSSGATFSIARTSNEFDASGHFLCFHRVTNQRQKANDLSNASRVLGAVDDSAMIGTGEAYVEKVSIVCKEYAPLTNREFELSFVARGNKIGVGRCRYVDSSQAEPVADPMMHVFIKVKSDHSWHAHSSVFLRVGLVPCSIVRRPPGLAPRGSRS